MLDKNNCQKLIKNFLEEREKELKILNQILKNGSTIFVYNYEYIKKTNNDLLIKGAANNINIFLKKHQKLNFEFNKKISFEKLIEKYGLDIESAKNIQSKMDYKFKNWEQNSGIHGNHISKFDPVILNKFEDFINNLGYDAQMRNVEDDKHFKNIQEIINKKKSNKMINELSEFIQ